MYIFHNRPLALACCVFALTAAIASKLSLESVVALGIACGVGCLLLFLIWFKRRKKQIFLSFLCCLFASVALASSFLFFHVHYAKYQSFVDRECIIEGTVLKRTSSASHASSFYVQMDSLNGEQVFADVKLECDYVSSLQPGDRFCATTTGRAFETDGSFDEAVYSLSDGIVLALVCSGSENCRIEEEKGSSLRVLFANWNDELSFMIRDSVGGEAGNLVSALLLGNRSAISGDTELQFRRAGVGC